MWYMHRRMPRRGDLGRRHLSHQSATVHRLWFVRCCLSFGSDPSGSGIKPAIATHQAIIHVEIGESDKRSRLHVFFVPLILILRDPKHTCVMLATDVLDLKQALDWLSCCALSAGCRLSLRPRKERTSASAPTTLNYFRTNGNCTLSDPRHAGRYATRAGAAGI